MPQNKVFILLIKTVFMLVDVMTPYFCFLQRSLSCKASPLTNLSLAYVSYISVIRHFILIMSAAAVNLMVSIFLYFVDTYSGTYNNSKNYMGKFTDNGPRGKGFSNFSDPYRVGVTNRVSIN